MSSRQWVIGAGLWLVTGASFSQAAECSAPLRATRPSHHGATVVFGVIGGDYQQVAGSVGLVLGSKLDHGPVQLSRGLLLDAEVGASGFHVSAGWAALVAKIRSTYEGNLSRCDGRLTRGRLAAPVAGLSVKAVLHRTWGEPRGLETSRTYLGGMLEATVLARFRVGVLRAMGEGPVPERWVFVWGVGAGF